MPNLAKHWCICRNVTNGTVFPARVYRTLPASAPYQHIGHFATEAEVRAFLATAEGYYAAHPEKVRRAGPIADMSIVVGV